MTPDEVRHRYERLVRDAQRNGRIPAVTVAVHRADRPLWTFQVGMSGTDRPLDEGTRMRIGSITKTFTAVLVMQCRDDGLLDLDDAIGRHLDLPAHGEATVRRLLSHTAGLQREPYGDVWDTLRAPDLDTLLADLARAERVLPPARRHHYSNLGFALLGQLVAALRGGTWAEVLTERIVDPLGLASVGVDPGPEAAVGYLVDAYSDHARPEQPTDFGAVAPAAQLWGTAADLARWAAFLSDPAAADPGERVLARRTLEEMRWPLTPTDEALWAVAYGLGLILVPQGDRVVHVGHDGAMGGFLAGAYGRRGGGAPAGLAVAALGSSGTGTATLDLPHDLLRAVVEADPPDVEPWVPGPPVPAEYRSVLGRWWSEGFEYVFGWHDGSLQARGADDAKGRPPAVFEPVGPDLLRSVSGRENGELLRLTRDDAGTVTRMHWATYRYTRVQETFEGLPASGG